MRCYFLKSSSHFSISHIIWKISFYFLFESSILCGVLLIRKVCNPRIRVTCYVKVQIAIGRSILIYWAHKTFWGVLVPKVQPLKHRYTNTIKSFDEFIINCYHMGKFKWTVNNMNHETVSGWFYLTFSRQFVGSIITFTFNTKNRKKIIGNLCVYTAQIWRRPGKMK